MSRIDFAAAKRSALYQILNTPVRPWPSPHLYTAPFPATLVKRMCAAVPDQGQFTTLAALGRVKPGTYESRLVMTRDMLVEDLFWRDVLMHVFDTEFCQAMMTLWRPVIYGRPELFPAGQSTLAGGVKRDVLLVRDKPGYKLGPHTDAPHKLVSLLLYLPDASATDETPGTALYIPKERGYRCKGGPHYPPENFELVWQAPYAAGGVFMFPKTDVSFHGVPQTPRERRLLLVDLQLNKGA